MFLINSGTLAGFLLNAPLSLKVRRVLK